jgi:peptidoglycan/LPS O-acetylase OafA/YrhL
VATLGEFLGELPMPLGPIVTGLLPPIAIGSLLGALYAFRKSRRLAASALVVIGFAATICAVAFYGYASGQT